MSVRNGSTSIHAVWRDQLVEAKQFLRGVTMYQNERPQSTHMWLENFAIA